MTFDIRIARFLDTNLAVGTPNDFWDLAKLLVDHCHRTRRGVPVHLTNAYTLACADKDAAHAALLSANLSLPDGVPLARLLRAKLGHGEQMYGPDLFLKVIEQSEHSGIRHFLLGGTESVCTALEKSITERFPQSIIAGRFSPPFRRLTQSDRLEICGLFTAAEADIVWVGLGTPKQDFEANELAHMYPGVFFAVGAAFDFHAGAKVDCPPWLRQMGLQWLHRLLHEPRRLWKRYVFGNIRFIKCVILKWRKPVSSGSLVAWLDQSRQ